MAIEATNRIRTIAVIWTVAFFVAEWLMFELIRLPYRPPEDMLTLLGTEKYTVMFTMLVLAVTLFCIAIGWMISIRFTALDYCVYAILLASLITSVIAVALHPPWVVTPFELILS